MTNTISANVTSTVPINFDDKKVKYKMDCYILNMFSLVTMLLFIIANIYHYYTKHRSKQNNTGTLTIQKWLTMF